MKDTFQQKKKILSSKKLHLKRNSVTYAEIIDQKAQ